ncbi:MAG: PSP1 domain-containing protein [Planctomycetota bacterium]|jgi:cell fate regulator YaaT (PSP1 superfamily)
MSQDENVKNKAPKNAKHMLVRYGRMGAMGWFEHHENHIPKLSSHVVIKTERGLELGEVVGVHNYKGGQFKSTPEQVENYFCNRTKDYPLVEGGQFVRFATHEDLGEQKHLEKSAIDEAKICQKYAEERGLKMKIIEAEHLFGGERIIFYFTSEGRVDFRDLVKQLAREYQTRIELRQIGSRDEARLVSDFETCGQQCCCSRYLKILEPVNMRMAKLQKATLDPSKISGHCGRLKCCLRYEDETYMELKKNLPKRNATVVTPKGEGKVVDMHILTQLVVVQDKMGDRKAWPIDEIWRPGEEPKNKPEPESDRAEDILDKAMGRPGKGAVSDAVTGEIEEMAQSEQQMPEQGQKKNRRRRRRKPKQGGQQGEGKQGEAKQGNKQNKQDGQKQNAQGGQQDQKSSRNRRNRRRRNKNRDGNAPQNGQGGNKPNGQNKQNGNENRPKQDKPKPQSNDSQPKQGGE